MSLTEARTYAALATAATLTAGAGLTALAGTPAGVIAAVTSLTAFLATIHALVTRPRG